jgi:glucan phosphoethanolaminetransferase (alkaline phosphatase superfamily)
VATPEEERTELLTLLRIAEDRRWHHHTALWEEEKHFTWWIALIFPALVFVQTNKDLTANSRLLLTVILAAFGIFVSLIALRIFRREGISFVETLQTVNCVAHVLGLHLEAPYESVPMGRRLALTRHYDTTLPPANKPLWYLWLLFLPLGIWALAYCSKIVRRKPPSFGVRDCFQLLFAVSIVLFACFAVWGVLARIGL